MKHALLLLAVGLVGCSHSRSLPEPDGEAFDEGLYGFDRQREALRGTAQLDPWSPGFFYPALAEPEHVLAEPEREFALRPRPHTTANGPIQASAWVWYQGYKQTLSKVDGNSCRFYPSCSTFGLRAVRRHGLLGVAMTFGRLHKNHQDARHYPIIRPPFLDDPVANYSFWLRQPELDHFDDYDNPAHAWFQHVRATQTLRY